MTHSIVRQYLWFGESILYGRNHQARAWRARLFHKFQCRYLSFLCVKWAQENLDRTVKHKFNRLTFGKLVCRCKPLLYVLVSSYFRAISFLNDISSYYSQLIHTRTLKCYSENKTPQLSAETVKGYIPNIKQNDFVLIIRVVTWRWAWKWLGAGLCYP